MATFAVNPVGISKIPRTQLAQPTNLLEKSEEEKKYPELTPELKEVIEDYSQDYSQGRRNLPEGLKIFFEEMYYPLKVGGIAPDIALKAALIMYLVGEEDFQTAATMTGRYSPNTGYILSNIHDLNLILGMLYSFKYYPAWGYVTKSGRIEDAFKGIFGKVELSPEEIRFKKLGPFTLPEFIKDAEFNKAREEIKALSPEGKQKLAAETRDITYIYALSYDNDLVTRRILAWRALTPPDILDRLAEIDDEDIEKGIAGTFFNRPKHEAIYPGTLAKLLEKSKYPSVKLLVATNLKTPIECLVKILKESDETLKKAVVELFREHSPSITEKSPPALVELASLVKAFEEGEKSKKAPPPTKSKEDEKVYQKESEKYKAFSKDKNWADKNFLKFIRLYYSGEELDTLISLFNYKWRGATSLAKDVPPEELTQIREESLGEMLKELTPQRLRIMLLFIERMVGQHLIVEEDGKLTRKEIGAEIADKFIPLLSYVAQKGNINLKVQLGKWSLLPEAVQDILIADQEGKVRASLVGEGYVTEGRKLSPKVILALYNHSDKKIRMIIAYNNSLQNDPLIEAQLKLLRDKDPDVRALAISNPNIKKVIARHPEAIFDPLYHLENYSKSKYLGIDPVELVGSTFIYPAAEAFAKKDYKTAVDLLEKCRQIPWIPYGIYRDLGNAYLKLGDKTKALHYYQLAKSRDHDVLAANLLSLVEKGAAIEDCHLEISEPAETIISNLARFSQLQDKDLVSLQNFLKEIYSLNITDNSHLEYRLTFETYLAADMIRQGFLDFSDALSSLEITLKEIKEKSKSLGPDGLAKYMGENWGELRKGFLTGLIEKSRLGNQTRLEFLNIVKSGTEEEKTLLEFFLRSGVWGIYKYKDYPSFRKNITWDAIPDFYEEDLAKALFLETVDIAKDVFYRDPEFLRRLLVLRQNGFYGDVENKSFKQIAGDITITGGILGSKPHGQGPLGTVFRAEVGHQVSEGSLDAYIGNPSIGELQDRTSSLKFPTKINKETVKAYADLSRGYYALYEKALKTLGPKQVLALLSSTQGKNETEICFIQSAIAGLTEKENDSLARRIIGEGIYYALKDPDIFGKINNPAKESLTPELSKVEQRKETVENLPSAERLLFEGGFFLSTYNEVEPVIRAPLLPMLGKKSIKLVEYAEAHVAAEWYDYLLKLRIQTLLADSQLNPEEVLPFYRNAALFLEYQVNLGLQSKFAKSFIKRGEESLQKGSQENLIPILYYFYKIFGHTVANDEFKSFAQELSSKIKINRQTIRGMLEELLSKLKGLVVKVNIFDSIKIDSWLTDVKKIIEDINKGEVANIELALQIKELSDTFYYYLKKGSKGFRQIEQKVPVKDIFKTIFTHVWIEEADLRKIIGNLKMWQNVGKEKANEDASLITALRSLKKEDVYQVPIERMVVRSEPEKAVLSLVLEKIKTDFLSQGKEFDFNKLAAVIEEYRRKYDLLLTARRSIDLDKLNALKGKFLAGEITYEEMLDNITQK